eukprot:jgi/Mesen1/4256/ME000022S03543
MAALSSAAHCASEFSTFECSLWRALQQKPRSHASRTYVKGLTSRPSLLGAWHQRQPRQPFGLVAFHSFANGGLRNQLTVYSKFSEDFTSSQAGLSVGGYEQTAANANAVTHAVSEQGTGNKEVEKVLECAGQVASAKTAGPNLATKQNSRRQSERQTYLFAAIASSVGFVALAGGAVVYRFVSQMQYGGQVPYAEIAGTFALAIGAAVGMEYWARWAHKALWHASLWNMHESHHRAREGPFELNDIFAITNAVPAILLLAYGFFNKGFIPGLSFGAGLGITLFGMAYMFVHDGLVHRRFPVGPVANVPYLQKVAAAHQLHHADKFEGVPYGLFLGPQELEVVGGLPDLEALLSTKAGKSGPNAIVKEE